VVLADDLVEGPGPESQGEGRLGGEPFASGGGEEVLSDPATLPAALASVLCRLGWTCSGSGDKETAVPYAVTVTSLEIGVPPGCET
jgi:hypothetical protein